MRNTYVDWKRWRGAEFGAVRPDEVIYFDRETRACGLPSIRGLKVGELGYGNGAFAGWVRASGGDWTGRESIPEIQEKAADAGFRVLAPEAAFSSVYGPDSFDVVAAFDVIEHLDIQSIRSFLCEVREALKPGGWLLIRVPSGDSPFANAIHSGDVTHRTVLGSSAVRQLAEEAGLLVVQVRAAVLPIAGFGMLQAVRRTVVIAVQWIVFKFVGAVLMGNNSAVVSPTMMVVLSRPKS